MPKYDYETEEKAQEALDQATSKRFGYCPIARAICQKDCVCYGKGSLYKCKTKNTKYRIIPPYCKNVIISGVITVNGE